MFITVHDGGAVYRVNTNVITYIDDLVIENDNSHIGYIHFVNGSTLLTDETSEEIMSMIKEG